MKPWQWVAGLVAVPILLATVWFATGALASQESPELGTSITVPARTSSAPQIGRSTPGAPRSTDPAPSGQPTLSRSPRPDVSGAVQVTPRPACSAGDQDSDHDPDDDPGETRGDCD